MDQLELSALVARVPSSESWARLLLTRSGESWVLSYGQIVIGREPTSWTNEVWRYGAVTFVSARVQAQDLLVAISQDSCVCAAAGAFTFWVPAVQTVAQIRHRPSFEVHDRDATPMPSFEYTVSAADSSAGTNTAGRHDYLVGPDSPSFTDLDAAYRAFFLGQYEVPANASVPSELLSVRVLDERAWLGPIHIRPTQMTVQVLGEAAAGVTLEYFSPAHRERHLLGGPTEVAIELPDGLPTSNTWLWLTQGTEWRDFRALTPPWASADQLRTSKVEQEPSSRDEQAAAEAVVYGGEGPFVEFKRELPAKASTTPGVFKTIAAFANGSGGTIVFGVDRDEVTVVGLDPSLDLTRERDRIGQAIRSRIIPTPPVQTSTFDLDGKTVLFLVVEPGPIRPYGVVPHTDHRDRPQYYVRRGANTYPALPSDLQEIMR